MQNDALQAAQDHLRTLQDSYRKAISEGTVVKSDKFKCEKVRVICVLDYRKSLRLPCLSTTRATA